MAMHSAGWLLCSRKGGTDSPKALPDHDKRPNSGGNSPVKADKSGSVRDHYVTENKAFAGSETRPSEMVT
eukprot:Skav218778  [mRNA]  locus=scaffold1372:405777:407382:- [translate_table: standard]